MFFVPLTVGSIAWAQNGDDHFARIIGAEQQRQRDVGSRLHRSIGDLETLLEDLKSNELENDPGGAKLRHISQVLARVREEHVTKARQLLDHARSQRNERSANLSLAEAEISAVVRGLAELIDQAGDEHKRRLLVALLQAIAERQWNLMHDTVTWGRAAQHDAESAEQAAQRLIDQQSVIATELQVFLARLEQEMADGASEELAEILQRAHTTLVDGQAVQNQRASWRSLKELNAALSVTQQQEALKVVYMAIDILNGLTSEELERLLEQTALKGELRKIIQLEIDVRLAVLKVTQTDLAANVEPHLGDQSNVTKKLELLQPRIEKAFPGEMLGAAVELALKEMKLAEQELRAADRSAATEAQRRAIEMLEAALREAEEGFGAGDDHLGLGLSDLGGPLDAMNAWLSVPVGLEEMLLQMNLMGVDMGRLMQLDGDGGLPGEGGLGAGTAAGGNSPPSFGGNGEGEGEGDGSGEGPPENMGSAGGFRWGSDMVGDDEVARGNQRDGHLDRISRTQIQQVYEGGLPPEFRGMIQDYFEVLAAEGD